MQTKLNKLQIKKLILGILIVSIPVSPVYSQSRKVRKAMKKSENAEENTEKTYDKGRDEALKHRYDIQTKEVQKRMKESKKKADQYNRSNREPFYKELFNRKKKHKKRKR
jgi:hypothetical protein